MNSFFFLQGQEFHIDLCLQLQMLAIKLMVKAIKLKVRSKCIAERANAMYYYVCTIKKYETRKKYMDFNFSLNRNSVLKQIWYCTINTNPWYIPSIISNPIISSKQMPSKFQLTIYILLHIIVISYMGLENYGIKERSIGSFWKHACKLIPNRQKPSNHKKTLSVQPEW